MSDKSIADTILALETAALERWGKGDPSGFVETSAPDVTYFDPFIERRINGRDALAAYYERLRGKVRIDRFEWIEPQVTVCGDVAVLTFNMVSHAGPAQYRWNCTEVYRLTDSCWRIIQTHWSLIKPLG